MKKLSPVKVTEPQPGTFVYDFGQNFAGWVKFKAQAATGTVVTLRFAEEIKDNGLIDPATTCVYNARAPRIVQTDNYIFKGKGLEEFEPRFTYHGFRYVEVTGLDEKNSPGTNAGIFSL